MLWRTKIRQQNVSRHQILKQVTVKWDNRHVATSFHNFAAFPVKFGTNKIVCVVSCTFAIFAQPPPTRLNSHQTSPTDIALFIEHIQTQLQLWSRTELHESIADGKGVAFYHANLKHHPFPLHFPHLRLQSLSWEHVARKSSLDGGVSTGGGADFSFPYGVQVKQ